MVLIMLMRVSRFVFFILMGSLISFYAPSSSASDIQFEDSTNEENIFPTLVRLFPCEDLSEGFKKYSQERVLYFKQQKDAQNAELWNQISQTPLKILHQYVKEYIGEKRKLVVGCVHEKRVGVSTSLSGAVLCRGNETHLHEDAITIVDDYTVYKKGTFYVAPPQVGIPSSAFILDGCRFHRAPTEVVSDISKDLSVDFLRFYPFGLGSDDFPKDFFDEIYMERAGYETGVLEISYSFNKGERINHSFNQSLELLTAHLRPGGRLIFDFDGKEISLDPKPLIQKPWIPYVGAVFTELKTRWDLYYGNTSEYLIDSNSEIKKDSTGKVVLVLAEGNKNYGFLQKQINRWKEETWMPNTLFNMLSREILDQNRAVLEKVWMMQAATQKNILEKFGYKNVQFFLGVNPRNNRHASRLIMATKE